MATEVKLPDMGEEIEDVTINRWLTQEGDSIQEGDTLVEVATDKVDTEIPAPVGGVVLKLNFSEGELVPVDAVLAVIGEEGEEGEAPAATPAGEEEAAAEEEVAGEESAEMEEETAAAEPESAEKEEPRATPVAKRVAQEEGIALSEVSGTGSGGQITKEDVLGYLDRRRDGRGVEPTKSAKPRALPGDLADVAPLSVRRLAAQHSVDLREVAEDRPLSALTRHDVLSFVASREAGEPVTVEPGYPTEPKAEKPEKAEKSAPSKPAAKAETKAEKPEKAATQPQASERIEPGENEEFVAHGRMRKIIARNTVESAFSIPHVTTMWDVDMSNVIAHRKAHKAEYAQSGVNLTLTAYLVKAIVTGLKAVPVANATWTDDGLLIKRNYNIGMAVALPKDQYGIHGLIVPVIKHADDLSLQGMARAVNDLAERARNNQLGTDDLQGGTFTLTNYGTSGSRFQTPIIVKPQVGILGVGAIEKRAVVVSNGHPLEANMGDHLSFLPMATLGFSYDHRVLDGASADAFCAAVKEALENWQ